MNVTEFLVIHARKYASCEELFQKARTCLLKPTEGRKEFASLLERWMRKYRDGNLPGGYCWYSELPVSTRRTFTVRSPGGKNVALLLVAKPVV